MSVMQPLPIFQPDQELGGLPVCIISLKDAHARRERLRERGFPHEWVAGYFEASDFRNETHPIAQKYTDIQTTTDRYGRILRPAEIGCALSHLEAYKWLASSDHDLMLVLEDDVVPTSVAHCEHVEAVCGALDPLARAGAAFICHLGVQDSYFRYWGWRKVKRPPGKDNGSSIVLHNDKGRDVWLAHAYLISKPAATRMLKHSCVRWVADDFSAFLEEGTIDKIFITRPGIYRQDGDLESTVQLTDVRPKYRHKRSMSLVKKIYYRIQSSFTRFIPYRLEK